MAAGSWLHSSADTSPILLGVSKMDRPYQPDLSTLFPERKTPFTKGSNGLGTRGRRVLITGAAGSIGSALAGEILREAPQQLLLLDHSEQALYDLQQEFRERGPSARTRFILGDVRDERFIRELLAAEAPDTIFHAAAFKHVPLLEEIPFTAIENNGLATWRLARSAARSGVKKLLLISTDKAANPQSILGVSKRLAEAAISRWTSSDSLMSALRLGNVAGSSGSVLPVFCEQIKRGGPVTVTHPEVTRYFLTMNEACSAIGALAGAENASGLFVPEMGEALSILKVAERMINAANLAGKQAMQVEITGLRPGDKLHEDLLSRSEWFGAELANGIRRIDSERVPGDRIDAQFEKLEEVTNRRCLPALLEVLREGVLEYQPGPLLTGRLVALAAGAGYD
jgi:FlaA1/EpsC-like NDP-sugar epimerase